MIKYILYQFIYLEVFMNEQQFLKTMIEVIKYDEIQNRDELLGILRN